MVHAAAVALVHPYHVHARRQAVARVSQHVLRFVRSLETMDDDERQHAPILLPVTEAEHGNSIFYFDQALFGGRQVDAALEKEGSESLRMSTLQPAMRPENRKKK